MTASRVSRRSFLSGAVSLAALSGCRSVCALSGRPNLRLGVLADIHISAEDGDFHKFGDTEIFKRALRWFRDQDVDGVIIAGDMADNGVVSQLKKVAEAWYEVFPGDRGRDGGKVEKLFVCGNHDVEGQHYDSFAVRFHEPESFKADWVVSDIKGVWQRLFREPYEPIWMKRVKGYQIIGAHWDKWEGVRALEKWFADNDGRIDRHQPFFYIQHALPKNTCFGDRAWGQDNGCSVRALSKFPNAVSICGHSHYPLTDDRFIWLDGFTSIQCPSLRYGSSGNVAILNPPKTKLKACNGSSTSLWNTRQGLMIDVYGSEMKIVCRDFQNNEYVRGDIVLPVPFERAAFKDRAAGLPPPKFAPGSALTVDVKKNSWELSFPAAEGVPRTLEYIITAAGAGRTDTFYALAPDFERCLGKAADKVSVTIPKKDVAADVKFSVIPVDCYGREGNAIT